MLSVILLCSLSVIIFVLISIVYIRCVVHIFYYVFFFKQKTAYEMRISDWSSDVCSSDLGRDRFDEGHPGRYPAGLSRQGVRDRCSRESGNPEPRTPAPVILASRFRGSTWVEIRLYSGPTPPHMPWRYCTVISTCFTPAPTSTMPSLSIGVARPNLRLLGPQ